MSQLIAVESSTVSSGKTFYRLNESFYYWDIEAIKVILLLA